MRRNVINNSAQRNTQNGFTIVELLIVVVVIAILAAITVVAYNGITQRAVESSMKSDLKNTITIAEMDKTNTGAYPTSAAAANGGLGLKSSGDNVVSYDPRGESFCVSVSNPKAPAPLRYKSSTGQTTSGTCQVIVSTLAGAGGSGGFADGTGAAAQFYDLTNVAVDAGGTIYVADMGNSRIRKISPSGQVTTFAGSGTPGFADGTGAAAQFNYPRGVAVDGSGVVYVSDSGNGRIRKISQSGVVTTVPGAYIDGAHGIAVDGAGVVYVADFNNSRICKVSPSGTVTVLAGSGVYGFAEGIGTAAQFAAPTDVAVDSAGTVYVTDDYNNRIRTISPGGEVKTLAGSGIQGFVDGSSLTAQFYRPNAIDIDSAGTVYVGDYGNRRIRTISSNGEVATLAGVGSGFVDGISTVARFEGPFGIAVNSASTVYVTDGSNHRVRKIDQ